MATSIVLLDSRPDYLADESGAISLLLAPLGTETVLERLRAQLSAVEAHSWAVMPTFSWDLAYQSAIHALNPEIVILSSISTGKYLAAQEPSDWLLFADPRRFPARGFGAYVKTCIETDEAIVRHVVHIRKNGDGLHERVVYDERNHVSAIQRLYDGVTLVETAGVSLSFITAASAAHHLRRDDLLDLQRIRSRVVECGVPSQDITADDLLLDLTRSEDLLALNSTVTLEEASGPPESPFMEWGPGIWTGPGCQIHPTSRIYAPVILHARSSIGAEAVVTGPTVLGAGACIEERALVSQSLVTADTRITAGSVLVQRIVTRSSQRDVSSDSRFGRRLRPIAHFPRPLAHSENQQTDGALEHDSRSHRLAVALKRGMDFSLALFGLLALSPMLLFVAILIKLTSPGPVFFGHEREGLRGRIFRCWKFRTMIDRAHAQQRALYRNNNVDGPQFKMSNDPRVTRLGHWLRITNIDELPQLINVLRGEMSLIGPRPSPFRENQICVPWRNARLSVRPGITGLWQVCRQDRSAGDFHQWIYFDLLYVRHWSMGLDLGILLATALTIGGRWSVPLGWMVPAQVRRRELLEPPVDDQAWPSLRISNAADQTPVSSAAWGAS